jgi:hypothetical protein
MLKRRNSQSEDFFLNEVNIKPNGVFQATHTVQKNLQTNWAFCTLFSVRRLPTNDWC